MRWLAILGVLAMAACTDLPPAETTGPAPAPTQSAQPSKPAKPKMATASDLKSFARIVQRVEPVAERECRSRTKGMNCDFNFVVDDRPNQRQPNAFQTVDKNGRPILAFNLALIGSVRNADELAFVMGHEASHHIAGHLTRQQQNATAGAVLLGGLAALTGASSGAIRQATDIGAAVGARTYSKDFELEADALGTVITKKAGYDPVRGAQFFTQIPDPGDQFLGTHPPNAQRMETVRRVDASL